MKENQRRPFEADGQFYAGRVTHTSRDGRNVKRRVLCFALQVTAGVFVVAASPAFSRAEAYHTAKKAASGQLPVGEGLTDALRNRGFPVRYDGDALDDTTTQYLHSELRSRQAFQLSKEKS